MVYKKQKAEAKKKLEESLDRKKNSRVPYDRYVAGLDKDLKAGSPTINSRSGSPQKAAKERKAAMDIRNTQKIIDRADKKATDAVKKSKAKKKKPTKKK